MDFAPGDRVDRYELVQPLGEGGQGSVWRAQDPLFPGQPRAIKLVPLVMARPNDVERVRREARALFKLEHVSLVRCHALFEDLKHSALGVVMDFVDGASLRAAAGEPWMSDRHRTWALRHIAEALAYVHRNGVVHRDLKLDNVLVTRAFWDAPEEPRNVKVVDFGIAKVADGSHALTALDNIVGTLAYLAPELLDPAFFPNQAPATAVDVFAFGVLAWKLLAGGHPTGLPAAAGIVDYGAAYRAAASRNLAWPADAPPGPWGELLSACLCVRASERIPDGVQLAERCEKIGDFSTIVRPAAEATGTSGPTSVASPGAARMQTGMLAVTPADPLAPTAEVAAQGTSAAPDRAARARAITERQPVVARRREAESLTSNAVVKNQAPLAIPGRKASHEAAWLVFGGLGALVLLGLGLFVFLPRADRSPPLEPTISQPPTSAVVPLVTAAGPPSEAAPAPAVERGRGVVESPTRPAGCGVDRPICECCGSGRDCGPGACSEDLDPEAGWHLRLGRAVVDGAEVGNGSPSMELCLRIAREAERLKCTDLDEALAGGFQLMYVSRSELEGDGVEVELRSRSGSGKFPLRALFKSKLTRLALCRGLELDHFTNLESGGSGSAKLLLFLDDPMTPPAPCGAARP